MQLPILNIRKTIAGCLIISLLGCTNYENKKLIDVKINSVDRGSGKMRTNMFDTIEIRREGKGSLMKTFNEFGEYVTDSTGSVIVKIDSTKINDISVSGENVLGGMMFYPGNLKDGDEVNIEVFLIEIN